MFPTIGKSSSSALNSVTSEVCHAKLVLSTYKNSKSFGIYNTQYFKLEYSTHPNLQVDCSNPFLCPPKITAAGRRPRVKSNVRVNINIYGILHLYQCITHYALCTHFVHTHQLCTFCADTHCALAGKETQLLARSWIHWTRWWQVLLFIIMIMIMMEIEGIHHLQKLS